MWQAATHNNIGATYQLLGDLAKAEEHLSDALASTESVLGARHPSVARRAGNLGLVLQRKGDLDAALALLKRALSVAEAQKTHTRPAFVALQRNIYI